MGTGKNLAEACAIMQPEDEAEFSKGKVWWNA